MKTKKLTKNDLFLIYRTKIEKGKKLTKSEMAYQIGAKNAHSPISIFYDSYSRNEILNYFNLMFNVNTK
jgi:hypothetical protein